MLRYNLLAYTNLCGTLKGFVVVVVVVVRYNLQI
jgi:hypothetical protein